MRWISYGIAALVIYFLVQDVESSIQHYGSIYFQLQTNRWLQWALIALMVGNVLAESWKLTNGPSYGVNAWKAIQSTCCGYAVQWILPGWMGAWVGRMLNADADQGSHCTRVLLLGGFCQSAVNVAVGMLVGGLIGHLVLWPTHGNLVHIFVWIISLIVLFGIIGLLIWNHWAIGVRRFATNCFAFLYKDWESKQLIWIFACSVFRYVCYVLQFALLVSVLGQGELQQALNLGAIYFCLLSLVPVPGLWTVFTRAGAAMLVFPLFAMEADLGIFIGWLMILLNQGIPAIFGIGFLFIKSNRFRYDAFHDVCAHVVECIFWKRRT